MKEQRNGYLYASVVLVDKDGYDSDSFSARVEGADKDELMKNAWDILARQVVLSRKPGVVLRQQQNFSIQWPGDPPIPRRPQMPTPQEVDGVESEGLCRVS